MPKINQNAYEGRSATAQRAGVVSLDEIVAQSAAIFASPPPIGNTIPNAGTFTDLTINESLSMNGGAVTDNIGTATLVNGVATVLNTNVAASDRIMVVHGASNSSSEIGVLSVTITPATSFVITSLNPVDATTATGDLSTVNYIIVREV